MSRRKQNLNITYISERLQEGLRPISHCALSTVVAPMGYGKTTAINWFLSERAKAESAKVIRISVYSDNLAVLWKSIQNAFDRAGFSFLLNYACPSDDAGESLLADDLCHELAGGLPCYIFIDDFHLLTDSRVADFLCTLADRLPSNVHLLVAGRDRFLSAPQLMRLGNRVHSIGADLLRLNHTELSVYAHRCGLSLTEKDMEQILSSTEGWFAAVYLNLRTLLEHGVLPDGNSDIYTMFTEAMIHPLPAKKREFLAVMGLCDEFSAEMAAFVTGDAEAEQTITLLTEQNAFAKRLSDGKNYRFHHMMKECAQRTFHALPEEKQTAYSERLGLWYEKHGQYLHAMAAYRQSGNFDALLRVVRDDAGILLASLHPETVLSALDECPAAVLKNHPLSVLVLIRSMFNWRRIPKMMELKQLLMTAIEEDPEMPQEERGNLLGECDLIMSFLCYNDISAMSRLHRSASEQMSRPAISIQNTGGWTFGSPSVLMMFYRAPGELAGELAEMDDCMPHYYKITNGHGQGAEKIMRAEAAFMQGNFTDAEIALESAYAQIAGNGQENMTLCCDFLAWRLSLCTGFQPSCTAEERTAQLLKYHNAAWLNIWNASCAYYYALLEETGKIPEIFASHMLSSVNTLAPGKPMIEMIENQVYLAQGSYSKVAARSQTQLAVCDELHYALVALHIRIQQAAAYERLGKRPEARKILETALKDASPDGFLMPFVENYAYLKDLLQADALEENAFVLRIIELGKKFEFQKECLSAQSARPAVFATLTEREYAIVHLMAERLSNREIAEKLFLSEGSVKQYVSQIYAKLSIDGDTRTKKRRLIALTAEKN